MPFTTDDLQAAKMLLAYWDLTFHVACDLEQAGEDYVVTPRGGFPPCWKEICEAYITGWHARAICDNPTMVEGDA